MGYTKNVREIVAEIKLADAEQLARLEREYAHDPRASVAKALASARSHLEKARAEHERVDAMYEIMRRAGDDKVVVGIDEVGRGALAGPLTVAAVVLPNEPIIEGLDDSKKLTPKQREEVCARIEKHARAIGIVHIPPATIDKQGMSASLRSAMAKAIEKVKLEPDLVLIDGNPVHVHPAERCIVKGDSKVSCIAAASIVAKVRRDKLMEKADERYPGYEFAQSKGYGSPKHIEAIKEHGLTDYHRETFCTAFTQDTLFNL
ncbi:MAG: ribonuclease HII [Coriobacteriales bacterium]|jgi:ribonuclease HII